MKETRIAIRYAKALFDLSIEKNNVELINDDMRLVHDVCKENKDFVLMLSNPIVRTDKKLAVIHDIFEKHLQKMSMLFMDIITKAGREDFIDLIAEQFTKLYKEYKGIITTSLQTVVAIDDNIRRQLIDLLEKQTESKIELIWQKLNPLKYRQYCVSNCQASVIKLSWKRQVLFFRLVMELHVSMD